MVEMITIVISRALTTYICFNGYIRSYKHNLLQQMDD